MMIYPPVHLHFSLVYEKNVVKTKRNVKILNFSGSQFLYALQMHQSINSLYAPC